MDDGSETVAATPSASIAKGAMFSIKFRFKSTYFCTAALFSASLDLDSPKAKTANFSTLKNMLHFI